MTYVEARDVLRSAGYTVEDHASVNQLRSKKLIVAPTATQRGIGFYAALDWWHPKEEWRGLIGPCFITAGSPPPFTQSGLSWHWVLYHDNWPSLKPTEKEFATLQVAYGELMLELRSLIPNLSYSVIDRFLDVIQRHRSLSRIV